MLNIYRIKDQKNIEARDLIDSSRTDLYSVFGGGLLVSIAPVESIATVNNSKSKGEGLGFCIDAVYGELVIEYEEVE